MSQAWDLLGDCVTPRSASIKADAMTTPILWLFIGLVIALASFSIGVAAAAIDFCWVGKPRPSGAD